MTHPAHLPRLPSVRIRFFLLLLLGLLLPYSVRAQTLAISGDVQTHASLTNTAVTLSGKAELRLTGTTDPLAGCTVNLTSPDSWLIFTAIQPATVISTYLSRVRVNGAAATNGTNVRVAQFGDGAAVIPHAGDYSPLEVYDARYFAGKGKKLYPYVEYNDTRLGSMTQAIRSFRLKRGYMATFAENENGTGSCRVYIAQDGDLEVGRLPDSLDREVRFVRVFPWRWVNKKGFAGNIWQNLDVAWNYNWNLDKNSTANVEYVAIRQNRYWPSLDQDWKARGITHLLGYNEPDHADQANMTVAEAISGWPDLLGTGLRVGAPAITDGGSAWLYSFMDQAAAAGLRVDYVPVHYYRSFWNAGDPAGAANQFYNFLKGIHDRVQRPIWVTEFNNGANWTTDPDPTAAQQAATVEAMIEMLDNAPFVERYAIYNWVEDVRRVVWDDGWPTQAGQVYRDKVSPLSWKQRMADAGTGNSARYDFDGSADDIWGNGQDGMLVGTPSYAAGKYGQALQLDGVNDYVQLSPRIADTTSFTFAAWVLWNGGGNWQRIFDFGADTSNYLALTPKAGSSGGLRFLMRENGGTEQQLNAATLTTGVWTHVAVTITGDTGKLFVNGALVNTNTAMTIDPVDVGTEFNYLGKSRFNDPLFNGRLDDVRIVSSAMTDAQISALAATGPPQFASTTLTKPAALKSQPWSGSLAADATGGSGARTFEKMSGPAWLAVAQDGSLSGVPGFRDEGLNRFAVRVTDANGAIHQAMLEIPVSEAPGMVARYPFNGTVAAATGTANGVASGGPVYTTGRQAQAIDLDGTDDFVTLPEGVASHADITIATWVFWDGGNNWQRLFDFGNSGSESLFLTPKSGTGTLQFIIRNREDSHTLETTVLPTAQWVHLAVTIGSGTGRLYVNGALRDTEPVGITPLSLDPATNYLGKSPYDDPYFNGRIDEFAILNFAASQAQISLLMNGRAPAFTADPLSKPSATAGAAWNHSLALNATDPDAGSILTFSKVSGPAWLTVAPDGRISGQPAASDAGLNRFVVRVTDQTLLADDAVMNITVSGAAGLIAHYMFDGTAANTAGSGVGTLTGSPAYGAGMFDRALNFDGTDDAATLPAGTAAGLTDATFALRVRWDGGAAWQRIFDFGGGTTQYLMLSPSSGSGTVQFAMLNPGGTTQRLAGPEPLPVGEWAHVAVTLQGSTGTLYVNGAAVATAAMTIDPSAVSQTACLLGDSQFTADPAFAGAIDDFRVYSRSLSAAEIAALVRPAAPVAVPLDYPGWTTGIAFSAGQSTPDGDADGDGAPNVFEFLAGTNPLSTASLQLPAMELATGAQLGAGEPGKNYLVLRTRVRRERPGISLSAEAGASLDALSSGSAVSAGPPVPDGDFETLTWYHAVPPADSATGRGFMRLRATMP